MKILIIGYGVVGSNMHKIFPDADYYDPQYNESMHSIIMNTEYDIAFICVPTPSLPDGGCDTSIVYYAIKNHMEHVKIFCIKSTVCPGTTDAIKSALYKHIVFSPEYFGATPHANDYKQDFVILGGDREDREKIADAYANIFTGELKVFMTDAKTAEVVKYGENAWIGAKVSFCNEFKRICDTFEVEYSEWRELFLADDRISRAHTFVYPDKPFYDSHCLNKDIRAIIIAAKESGYTPELLQSIQAYNNKHKGG